MKKKTIIIVLLLLVIAAAALAAYVARSMPDKKSCEVIIKEQGSEEKTDLTGLSLKDVKGTITMASGKSKEINAKGIELKELLNGKSFKSVTVTADDNYSAKLTAEDIEKDGNVFLILGDEQKPRLVVMTDTNAKRDVKNVLMLELN